MSRDKKPLDPPVYVKNAQGEEIRVSVGPLSWLGLKNLRDAISGADLPLPSLATDSISSWLKNQQTDLSSIESTNDPNEVAKLLAISAQRQNLGLYQAMVDLLSANFAVLCKWATQSPEIAESLVSGATGLSQSQIESLSAGEFLAIARASLSSLLDSGVVAEISGFFGELLRQILGGGAPEATSEQSPSSDAAPSLTESASESKSASPG